MTWTPISGTLPQYQKSDGTLASGYYLKFYQAGTSTAFSMATDSTGVTTLAKCQINSSGYPVNGSGDPFIPHVDQSYKIVLYKNSTDADADTTANADWVVDGVTQNILRSETVLGSAFSGQVMTLTSLTVVGGGIGNFILFRNGHALEEGASNDYVVSSSTTITINSSITISPTDKYTVWKLF